MEISELWENDLFLNKNIPFIFNGDITEYDMKEAGFSLIQEYNLLPQKMIDTMKMSTKEARKFQIGTIERTNKKLVQDKKDGFKKARKMFIEANNLDINDIITIKKDAIFTSKSCKVTQFGKYIDFRGKNQYTAYLYINGIEFYNGQDGYAVKGISDDKLPLHEDYMIKFLISFCKKMETDTNDNVIDYVRRFIDKYKRKELETGYYRRFDRSSDMDIIHEEDGRQIDISYNYFHILLPLIKIPL